MTEDKQHQLDELSISNILSYLSTRAFTMEEYIRGANKQIETLTDKFNRKSSQLTKATEIIKKFSEFVNNKVEYAPEHLQEHTDLWNELCEQAEQFLKEEQNG
jgi:hypothetical protein